MATANKAPTSDDATILGTWSGSAGSRYTLVDDYPDTTPNDVLNLSSASGGGYICFGYASNFSIPEGSTDISVQVRYYDRKTSTGSAASGARLKVGGSFYNSSTHNPSTTLTTRSENWATNPKSTANWTVDDINGVGSNALQGMGFYSSDSQPTIDYSCIEIQVTYTPPIIGTLNLSLGALALAGVALLTVAGSATPTLAAATLEAAGTVASAEITGTLTKTLDAATLAGAGTVETPRKAVLPVIVSEASVHRGRWRVRPTSPMIPFPPIGGTLEKTLGSLSVSGAGGVLAAGSASPTLGTATVSGIGATVVAGTATPALGAATISGIGASAVTGSAAPSLEAAALSATGTVTSEEARAAVRPVIVSEAAVHRGRWRTRPTAAPSALPEITGTLTKTLAAVTVSGVGAVAVAGTSAPSLAAASLSAQAAVGIAGSATPTLGAVTPSASGGVTVAGTGAPVLGVLAATTSGAVGISGSAAPSVGPATLEAVGFVGTPPAIGELAKTLDAASLSAAGTNTTHGTAAPTLEAASVSAAGTVEDHGALSRTLGPVTSAATGAVGIVGTAAPALASATLAGAGTVAWPARVGSLDAALGAASLSASGLVETFHIQAPGAEATIVPVAVVGPLVPVQHTATLVSVQLTAIVTRSNVEGEIP